MRFKYLCTNTQIKPKHMVDNSKSTLSRFCNKSVLNAILFYTITILYIFSGGLRIVLYVRLSKYLGVFFFFTMQFVFQIFYVFIISLVFLFFWLLFLHKQSQNKVTIEDTFYDIEYNLYNDGENDDDARELVSLSDTDDNNELSSTCGGGLNSNACYDADDQNVGKSQRYGSPLSISSISSQYTNTPHVYKLRSDVADLSGVINTYSTPPDQIAIQRAIDEELNDYPDDFIVREKVFFKNSKNVDTPGEAAPHINTNSSKNWISNYFKRTREKISKCFTCHRCDGIDHIRPDVTLAILTVAFFETIVFLLQYPAMIYVSGPLLILSTAITLPILYIYETTSGVKGFTIFGATGALMILVGAIIVVVVHRDDLGAHITKNNDIIYKVSIFLLMFSCLISAMTQLYRERILRKYQVNFFQFVTWVGFYKLPLNVLTLPLVLWDLPEPALNISSEDFFKYVYESLSCLFQSLNFTSNDLKQYTHNAIWKILHQWSTNTSRFWNATNSFEDVYNTTYTSSESIQVTLNQRDFWKLIHPNHRFSTEDNGLLNVTETVPILRNETFGSWELEAHCTDRVMFFFWGLIIVSIFTDVCYMFILNIKGASVAWVCQMLQYFPAFLFFTSYDLIGRYDNSPILKPDIIICALYLIGAAFYVIPSSRIQLKKKTG